MEKPKAGVLYLNAAVNLIRERLHCPWNYRAITLDGCWLLNYLYIEATYMNRICTVSHMRTHLSR